MINLLQPLNFYDFQLEQNQYRENCAGAVPDNCQMVSDNKTLGSWQISVPFDVIAIQSIMLYSNGHIYELNVISNAAIIKLVDNGTQKWIVYTGVQLIFKDNDGDESPLVLAPGIYDWRIKAGGKTYYSEQFIISGKEMCRHDWGLKIQAWNTKVWNGLYFNDADFKFTAYFDTFISNGLVATADVSNKDGFQRDVLSQRVITINRQIKFNPMPNSVAMGLSMLTSLKNIHILDTLGNDYNVKNIKFTQTPVEGDCLDIVVIEFSIFDKDYIETNCSSNPTFVEP